MTIDVNYYCQFNRTGMGMHCERAFKAMTAVGASGITLNYVDYTREPVVARAINESQTGTGVTVFFRRFASQVVKPFGGRKALWFFFESNLLPRKWIDSLGLYDEIWAPSVWGLQVLIDHGVAPERIRLLESGVNTGVFQPASYAHDGFIFLSVGKYEKRKSIDEIIQAYTAEFPAPDYPQVQLWLKADFPLYPDRVQKLAESLRHDLRIRVIAGDATDEVMAKLYCMADAFVFPSKAEGFGLPALEAIACGVPLISTNVSAQSTFLDRIPGLYVPVAFDMVPIVDEDYRHFYSSDYDGGNFGEWAAPSMPSLRSAMREVYSRPALWRERANRARSVIRDEFSWDVIARKALATIRDLQGRGSRGSAT